MNAKYFGDSYDLVKRLLLASLDIDKRGWTLFPMLTKNKEEKPFDMRGYKKLLGIPNASEISSNVPWSKNPKDRKEQISKAEKCKTHLFIDPCTGIKESPSSQHLSLEELVRIVSSQSENCLVLVFDQSFNRGNENKKREETFVKLGKLHANGICGFYYVSHAAFLIAGEKELLEKAKENLREIGIPQDRLLSQAGEVKSN